jgi:hypothetical protein
MMRTALVAMWLGALAAGGALRAAQPPAQNAAPASRVTAAELHAAEGACDRVIREYGIESSVEHITPTHGVRVEGYGVVFVTDVNLAPLPLLYGFGGQINKKDLANVHEAKRKKLPAVRDVAVKIMRAAAQSLPHLADDQMIVVKIGFFYLDFEDRAGLPDSLTAQVRKRDVVEAANASPDELNARILINIAYQ